MNVVRCRRSVVRLLLALLLLHGSAVLVAGCDRQGPFLASVAYTINYDNRLGEAVNVSYRYDDEVEFDPGARVPARSKVGVHLMRRSTGVVIRITTSSGAVVFEQHYTWEEAGRGPELTIVIDR